MNGMVKMSARQSGKSWTMLAAAELLLLQQQRREGAITHAQQRNPGGEDARIPGRDGDSSTKSSESTGPGFDGGHYEEDF